MQMVPQPHSSGDALLGVIDIQSRWDWRVGRSYANGPQPHSSGVALLEVIDIQSCRDWRVVAHYTETGKWSFG